MVPFILVSCKKEHGLSLKTLAKKHAVTFNVTNFKQSHGAFALRIKSSHLASDTLANLAGYIDLLYYVVRDSNNTVIKTIVQDSTMANMGVITDSLATGNYSIGMVAGKNGLALTTDPGYGLLYGYSGNAWEDTFLTSFSLTVGSQDITMAPSLNRVVGKLEVTLQDAVPQNAARLLIAVANYSSEAQVFGGALPPNYQYFNYAVAIPASAIGQTNFTVDRLVFGNSGSYFDIHLVAEDAVGNVIGTAVAWSVVIPANQKLILSGNLFNSSYSQTFTASADTTWGSGGPQIGFSLRKH